MHERPPLDSGRHPFELFILGYGLISGVSLLVLGPPPATERLLGDGLALVWGGMLSFGCAVALVGVLAGPVCRRFGWPCQPAVTLLVEAVGLIAVGVAAIIYVVGVGATSPLPLSTRLLPMLILAGLATACFWRASQINRYIEAAIKQRDEER